MNNWELTSEEFEKLDDVQKSKYLDAKECMNSEDAGGHFGWVRGKNLLKQLGWTEQRRKEGHRVFISLCKPKI